MGVCPHALYQDLILDLKDVVGSDLISFFEKVSEPPPDLGLKEAACFSILKSFLKKLEVDNSSVHDNRALLKFLQINLDCKNWVLQYRDSWDEVLFGELRRTIWDFFSSDSTGQMPIFDSLDEFLHNGRVGPGAAIGAKGGDFYTKMFASPLTCTNRGLYIAYKNYIKNFPEFSNAENIRQENFGEAHVVQGNRLSFVPKNDQISRTICIEPSLNMFIQLGAGHVIERRLLSAFGISMADQPFKNRELARRGSVFGDLVTCDLSSASDSMSLKMLRAVLPKHVYDMLRLLRSPSCDIDGLGQVELDMVSTMGNGFTFPLQTMLFSAIVVSAARARGVKLRFPRGRDFGDWGVFGDDIICPRSIWGDVSRLLDLLGFKINLDKTFVEGPFRESCGSDYFQGQNIRGVYIKRLESQQDLCSAINQLNLFSTRTGILLPRCVQHLFRKTKRLFVPRWESSNSGIHIPFALVSKTVPRDEELCGTAIYWRYEPVGVKIRVLERSIWVPRGSKPRIYNPSGLFISFLQRSINSFTIGVRHDDIKYKRKLGRAPFWDALPTVHPLSGWFPWQRWDTAVYLNLYR